MKIAQTRCERFTSQEADWKFSASVCGHCGWWWADHEDHTNFSGKHETHWLSNTYYEGILRRFDASSKSVPIEELRRFISTHPTATTSLHHAVFEKLVASVYHDLFNCEVRQVGGPGDNGVDLWMIQADQPCLIQCKRRQNDSAIQGVEAVRELVGAIIFAGTQRGHLVTNARRFSGPAQRAAGSKALVETNIEITLINREDLLRMLQIANGRLEAYWADLLKQAMLKAQQGKPKYRSPPVPYIWNRRKKSNPLGGPSQEPRKRQG